MTADFWSSSRNGHRHVRRHVRKSKRSPGERSETRDHVEVDPHIAEPVIGRAFARPVGSCGLQRRSLCALVGTLAPSLVELRRTSRFADPTVCELLRVPRKRDLDM